MQDLSSQLSQVCHERTQAGDDSARALAPNAELDSRPLFAEAPLASPPIPLLKMKVPEWAVVSRILWHAGYHPRSRITGAPNIAAPRPPTSHRRANRDCATALVAHGYFNLIIGRELRHRGSTNRLASRTILELGDLSRP